MSPSSTVHGGHHDTKYVTLELLLHAAFVADEFWGFMLELGRMQGPYLLQKYWYPPQYRERFKTQNIYY